MIKKKIRKDETQKRHKRIRVKLKGTPERPRLAVYKSSKHIYAQLIDDVNGVTIVAASSIQAPLKDKIPHGANVAASTELGKIIAEQAKAKGITQVVFDRGGNLYHGRISAIADAAREAGLEF